jgi:hypothetical protein
MYSSAFIGVTNTNNNNNNPVVVKQVTTLADQIKKEFKPATTI